MVSRFEALERERARARATRRRPPRRVEFCGRNQNQNDQSDTHDDDDVDDSLLEAHGILMRAKLPVRLAELALRDDDDGSAILHA